MLRPMKWWGRTGEWPGETSPFLATASATRAVEPHSRSAIPDTDLFQSSYPGMRFLLNVFLCRLHRLFYSCSAAGFSILPRAPAGRAAHLSILQLLLGAAEERWGEGGTTQLSRAQTPLKLSPRRLQSQWGLLKDSNAFLFVGLVAFLTVRTSTLWEE